jgi:predicted ribosomally synthesized peptide with nif11-like leader
MSMDEARAYIARLKADDALRAKVLAATDEAARMACINAEGFACGAGEIEAAAAELSDAQLDAVAGGTGLTDFGGTTTIMTSTSTRKGL